MLLYDIILYKHVFENMYALRLYHAVCYLALSFSICLSGISLINCTMSTSMHYAFHLSAYFLIILPQVFQSSTDHHGIMMQRQSEKNIRHILRQQFLAAGAYKHG